MKKILVPGVREECELVCDVTGKPAAARLQLVGGWGSDFDGQELVADLSRETANEILAMLQAKYPQLKLADYELMGLGGCILHDCHRALLELEAMRKRARNRKKSQSAKARRHLKIDYKAAAKALRAIGPVDLPKRK